MEVFNKFYKVPLFKLIVAVVSVAIGILSWFYFYPCLSEKANALVGGLLAGLIVALLQFLLNWLEYTKIDKFTKLSIKEVKLDRADRKFYENLIRKSKSEISIMGVTANRFMEHFADLNSIHQQNKIIAEALNRGVKLKILVPKDDKLNSDDKAKAEITKKQFEKLKESPNGNNFEYRYFDHEAVHSIFIVDNECLIGPVFSHITSRDTPAIHFSDKRSAFAVKYIEYFDTVWGNAKP